MVWSQKCESGSGLSSRFGISDFKSSKTNSLFFSTLLPEVTTFIPGVGFLKQEAAKVLSPSISTMQALQFPSARYPGLSFQHKWGISRLNRLATCQIVSSLEAETILPFKLNSIVFIIASLSSSAI